jgi:hypothetical protein
MSGDIRYRVVQVTPELAQEWLTRNTRNRVPKPKRIEAFARDMQAGRWLENGDAIRFAGDHQLLLDGQNRLFGVVLSGVTVRMLVVTGLPVEAQATMDTGTSRSFADTLQIKGEVSPNMLAATTRRCLLWTEGVYSARSAPRAHTIGELDEFLAENPGVYASANVGNRVRRMVPLPGSVIGLCHWLFMQRSADDANEFCARLSDGAALPVGSPILTLRNRLIRDRDTSNRLSDMEQLALVIRAWNSWRAHENLSSLQLPKGGVTAANMPQPR